MKSYDEAIANSCTDTYTIGAAVSKADADFAYAQTQVTG
jgi:hypothetical protein